MPTSYFRSGESTRGLSRIPSITLTAAEEAMLAKAGLVTWWEATAGYRYLDAYPTWLDRKRGKKLRADGTSRPILATAQIGTVSALTFGTATQRLTDPDAQSYIPTAADWSVVIVGNHANASTLAVWGTKGTSGDETALIRLNTGAFRVTHGGTVLTTSGTLHASGPFYAIDAWDQSATRREVRINGVDEINQVTAVAGVNSVFCIGGNRTTAANPGGAGTSYGMVMIFNTCLLDGAHDTDRDDVEDLILDKFASATWT